jgi:trigger factor
MCQVTLRNLSTVRLPELTDEFAQKLSSGSVDELKDRVREAVLAAKESMARDYVQEQFFDQIMAKSTVHVPDTMWEPVAARRLNDIHAELSQHNKTVEDYAKENGMTVESLVEAWQQEAHMHVKRAVVIREIFAKEGMRLNNQDLNQELMEMANEYRIHPKELFETMKKNRSIHELEFRAIFRKVMDFLHEKANITEVSA